MKAVVFDRIGDPAEVLSLREVSVPVPGPGQVLVRMLASSINPGDFLFIQKLYPEPKIPSLPGQIAGNHGAGRVEALGPGVTGFEPGQLVAFSYLNTWAEYAAVPSEWLLPLPENYPLELAAQMVNIVSAWDLLEASGAQPGDRMAITAGYGTVPVLLAQLAAQRGIQVLSIVRKRRPTPAGLERALILEQSPQLDAHLQEVTQGRGIATAIDCVGGPLLATLVKSLALGGRALIYGGLDQAPFTLHAFDVLMRAGTIGSYAYRYFFEPPPADDGGYWQRLVERTLAEPPQTTIAGWHTLDDWRQAVTLSLTDASAGKRLFRM